jgi:hypothetical protein
MMGMLAFVARAVPVQAADQTPKTRVEWKIPAAGFAAAESYLGKPNSMQADPTSPKDTRGAPILLVITMVALLPQLANALISVYRNYRYGGVIISEDHGELKITTDPRIPPNNVIVTGKSQVSVLQLDDHSAEKLQSALTSLLSRRSSQE